MFAFNFICYFSFNASGNKKFCYGAKGENEVMALLESFRIQWNEYIKVFDKMGLSIQATRDDYEKLLTTRRKKLEKPLNGFEQITGDIKLDN